MIYFLSFIDPDRPRGQQFLGGCFVETAADEDPLQAAWNHRCNPGGEVAMLGLAEEFSPRLRPHLNRLMQREELDCVFQAVPFVNE